MLQGHRYGNSHAVGSHGVICHPAEVTNLYTTDNCKNIGLNVAFCFTNKHTKHVRIITWS